MIRKYLVYVHRYYRFFFRDKFDSPFMPSLVFGFNLMIFFVVLDEYWTGGTYLTKLKEFSQHTLSLLLILTVLFTNIWYRKRLPSNEELNKTNGMWIGLFSTVLLIILFIIVK